MAVVRLIEIFEALKQRKEDEERKRRENEEKEREELAERQNAILNEVDRLNFVADKLEDRIENLKDQQNGDKMRGINGGNGFDKGITLRARFNDDDDEMEDEMESDSEEMKDHFDRMSSLHQSITAGKIRMTNDDDDESS